MNNFDKLIKNKGLINSENIFYFGLGWSVLSLLFFLLYSITEPGKETSFSYLIGTYIWEMIAFLAAGLLCFRNWLAPNIASGKQVWQLMGIGMSLFFIGDIFFGIWELFLKLEPDVSPADFFYLGFYIFVTLGILLAVLPRRLNLSLIQWGIIAGIGIFGIILAVWIAILLPQSLPEVAEKANGAASQIPQWLKGLDKFLSNFSGIVNFLYVIFDIILLILASTLLLAFWGGKLSQPWRMIAGASFFLYIADMSVQYTSATAKIYESGNLLEVCFVFSGVLFALGAAREYDLSLSSRSSRSRRRR